MKSVHPYLNFAGNTEEAFTFYRSVFGGDFLGVMRFRDFSDNSMGIAEKDLDKIAHIALMLGEDTMLMGTDVVDSMPGELTVGNNHYIMLEVDSDDEAHQLFNALSQGGEVEMALQKVEWAETYGICKDRFGVQWMINFTGDVQFTPGPQT
jgi:PhnB protein